MAQLRATDLIISGGNCCQERTSLPLYTGILGELGDVVVLVLVVAVAVADIVVDVDQGCLHSVAGVTKWKVGDNRSQRFQQTP